MSLIALFLILVWNAFVLVGTTYIVIWLDHSGWWFLLALLLLVSPVRASRWSSRQGDRDIPKKRVIPLFLYPLVKSK